LQKKLSQVVRRKVKRQPKEAADNGLEVWRHKRRSVEERGDEGGQKGRKNNRKILTKRWMPKSGAGAQNCNSFREINNPTKKNIKSKQNKPPPQTPSSPNRGRI